MNDAVTLRIEDPELAHTVAAMLDGLAATSSALVITDRVGSIDPDGLTVLLVEPSDPSTWSPLVGDRRVTFVDRAAVSHQLPAVLRGHGVVGGRDEARADARLLGLVTSGWELDVVTTLELRATVAHPPVTNVVELELEHRSLGRTWPVTAAVTAVDGDGPWRVVARFVDVPVDAQRAISRSIRDLRTVDTIVATASGAEVAPGWWSPPADRWPELLGALAFGRAAVTLADPSGPVTGVVAAAADRSVRLELGGPCAEGPVCFSAAGGRVSVIGRGHLDDEGTVVVERVLTPDRRRVPRLRVPALPVALVEGADPVVVHEVSTTGVTMGAPGASGRLAPRPELSLDPVTSRPDGCVGARIGRTVDATFRGQRVEGLDPEAFGRVVRSRVPVRSTPFVTTVDGQEVVGLWTEVGDPGGPPLLVVVPPTWARTKESAGLLSQFVAANFLASPRRVGIARFDYRNTRGASFVRPEHRRPNEESLGFTVTEALADIEAVLDHGLARLGAEARCVLVGMSFSGPICLRAAATDERVSGLAQVMAASDLQNLIRMATSGVDVVAELRAATTPAPLNVLGVLMDPTVSIADAVVCDMAFLSSSQDDAARLDRPLLWVTGEHDGFVDPELVATVTAAAAGPTRTVSVPCGHVPTSSAEVIAAYGPLVAWLRELVDDPSTDLVVPDDEVALAITAEEFEAAPRTPMPSPSDYWRDYMLGDDGLVGYEILALTAEFADLMATQAAQLDLAPGCRLADIGSGLGHSLLHLPPMAGAGLDVHELELVPELLAVAVQRPVPDGLRVHPHRFDGAADELPSVLARCDRVLMSLFLTVLPDAPAFLRRLVEALPSGARVVASSARPDADLSMSYLDLIAGVSAGRIPPPLGLEPEAFVESIRRYQSSAAELFRHAEEGDLTLYTASELAAMLGDAGLEVLDQRSAGGSLAVVVTARKR